MKHDSDNLIVVKAKSFALRIINAYKHLCDCHSEYVMSKQLLRCGTSIGANVKEAVRGQSKNDFAAKMNIALKGASETEYWVELLSEANYFNEDEAESLLADCRQILRILMSIVKTSYSAAGK